MGYRSDVLSAVVFADEDHKTKALVSWKLHCAADNKLDVLDGHPKSDSFHEHITYHDLDGRPCILLRGDDWKWYEGYPSVDGWHHLLTWMSESQEAATVFLRIGEETNDVVEEFTESEWVGDFYPWDYFGINRSIRYAF